MSHRSPFCLTFIVAVLVLGSCSPQRATPIKEKDSICIGTNFYVVGDMKAYPWVKLDPNTRCAEHADAPSTYVNVDRVDAFQPNCVCRYSAACRKKCSDKDCLERCTD